MLQFVLTAMVLLFGLGGISARAENASAINGNCDTEIGANNRGSVSITCSGIPPEVAPQIAKLLNLLLNQQTQTSNISTKLDDLTEYLRDLNERGSASHITLAQRISLKAYQCKMGLDDLRAEVSQGDQPSSDTFAVNALEDEFIALLRAALPVDNSSALERLQNAHRKVERALRQYIMAAAQHIGLEMALQSEHNPSSTGASAAYLEQQRRDAAAAATAAGSLGRQAVTEFAGLCRAFAELESLCTSNLCTK